MESFDAVIFDMDGLLLDSERIALEVFNETCGRFGFAPRTEVFVRCLGVNKETSRRVLEQALQGLADPVAFGRAWDEAYALRVAREPAPLKDGVTALLEHLQSLGVPAAVATSTATERARAKLGGAGILHHFREVVGGDQVRRSKPQPDIYLRAAMLLEVDPTRCLALEDSENGVRAAVAAGMTVVQVPDIVPPSEELRREGHVVLASLREVVGHAFAGVPA
ncbi:MAG TPA: HAD family phosphatase [Steroidobacteraceae bacterium]|nr:HAD family phosphatase [Steroidobacteraceae bacterium]